MRKFYTEEEKKRALEMYRAGVGLEDIRKEIGICRATVSRLAAEAGLPPRHKTKQKQADKLCPSCRRRIPSNSLFCMFCGCDARSEEQVLVADLEKVLEFVSLLPETSRDECNKRVRGAIEYIRRVKK